MLKLAGLVLSFFAMIGLVISMELELTSRQKQLRALSVLISFLHDQICDLYLPLPTVINAAVRQMSSPYCEVCRRFSDELEKKSGEEVRILWQNSCKNQKRNFALSKEEWLVFLEIGDALSDGTIGFREQVFALLEKRAAFLQSEFAGSLAEKRRISRIGIVASGMFLIVLFI